MFTTLHLFLMWRIFNISVLVTCYAYRGTLYIILTRLLEDRVHHLNQNLSKYIAVAEESCPFLIRDKSDIYVFRQSAELNYTFVRL